VLLDRERSLLPATQPLVEVEMRRRERERLKREALERVNELKRLLEAAKRVYYQHLHDRTNDATEAAVATERRAFVAACPDEGCRGFLSTQYKCGTCLKRFCVACREPKPDDATHECDSGVVETMALIRRECRPCPNCGTAISRVSGCDHMWCTSCETGFSYVTGQRISDRQNTNPHMYERMRQLQQQAAPQGGESRRPQPEAEVGGGCGERASWPFVDRARCGPQLAFLLPMHHCGRHVEAVTLPALRSHNADTAELRVRYCLKDIDDKRFSSLLQQHERKRELNLEKMQVLEVFVLLAFEFFAALRDRPANDCAALCADFVNHVEEMVNAPLQSLADRYGRPMPHIRTDVRCCTVSCFQETGTAPRKLKRADAQRRGQDDDDDDDDDDEPPRIIDAARSLAPKR
jgi:hypothetical protein